MAPRLSHRLLPLTTSGARIVEAPTGRVVRLRGLNRSGLEYVQPAGRGFLRAAGISEDEIHAMVTDWGARVIRVPFNQDYAVRGRDACTGREYLESLDAIVAWAASRGAYTLLALQWLDADTRRGTLPDGRPNMVPPLPDGGTIGLWALLARRYRDEPAVLFDVLSEPHDALPDDHVALQGLDESGHLFALGTRRVRPGDWRRWAARLVSEIRREHPSALIFVSGVQWGFDLRGMPLRAAGSRVPMPDLVYCSHVYPWSRRGAWWRSPASRLAARLLRRPHAEWRSAFGFLARSCPVFVAEWGGEPRDVEWGRRLAGYLDRLDVGWAAWGWPDRPRLLSDDAGPADRLTPFGRLVRDALRHA